MRCSDELSKLKTREQLYSLVSYVSFFFLVFFYCRASHRALTVPYIAGDDDRLQTLRGAGRGRYRSFALTVDKSPVPTKQWPNLTGRNCSRVRNRLGGKTPIVK